MRIERWIKTLLCVFLHLTTKRCLSCCTLKIVFVVIFVGLLVYHTLMINCYAILSNGIISYDKTFCVGHLKMNDRRK